MMRNVILRGLPIAALAALLAAAPGPALTADDPPEMKVCLDDQLENEPRIAACTKVLAARDIGAEVRAEALITRGMLYDDEETYAKAIEDFTNALKLLPNDYATYVLRGNSHDANGSPQLAIADYTTAIKLAPDDAAAYYNRATVYEELGDKAKAIADYKKALEIDPEYGDAKEALEELQK